MSEPDKKPKTVILNPEQKEYIDKNWDKVKFIDLVRGAFNDEGLDGRSKEGKAVQEYLGPREPVPTAYQRLPKLELSAEHKEFITNNAKFMSSTEMARTLFNNKSLGPLNLETRAVHSFLKTLPPEVSGKSFADETHDTYSPARTLKQIVEKVNSFVFTNYVVEDLNAQQRKFFEAILSFLRSPRFLQMINSYSSKMNREIFEGEFVRTVYDKPDLTPDELNLCINLAWNYVQMITINKHLEMLNQRYELVVGDPDNKMSMTLAEMITAKTNELNNCDKRQQALIADLNGKRADRNKNKQSNSISMANVIEMWKDEEERRKMLRNAELRKLAVADEVDRIESMDEFKSRLLGFTKSELING
jgi:hypothetical protein